MMTQKAKTILETGDVRARVLTLEAGETTPPHYHTRVTDHIFCLEGRIEIRLQAPESVHHLGPGERHSISPNRVHAVRNTGACGASYLLIQGVGAYDFIET